MRKFVCWAILLAFSFQSLAWASPKDEPSVETIRHKISKSVDQQLRISIATKDGRKLQGYVSQARADDFILSNEGTSTTLKYDEISRVNIPMSRGMKRAILWVTSGAIAGTSIALAHH
jgi:hypothetical protein